MKLASYERDGQMRVGIVDSEAQTVCEIKGIESDGGQVKPWDMIELIDRLANRGWIPQVDGVSVPLSQVRLAAPIPAPRRNLWCVGRNYRPHAAELSASVFKNNDADLGSWPIIFTKAPQSVVGPFDDVDLAAEATQCVDYEAELAVVIGKPGKNIRAADAMSHVFGYTVVNDVTARDVQMRHQQWDMGKSFDTFCPMGPFIVTADELDGSRTRVRCWVNGDLRQDGLTEDLIFDIPTLIETVSRGISLFPGDVIATGTPAGVGMGLKPPRYLKHGDTIRIEVDGLGVIENRFV